MEAKEFLEELYQNDEISEFDKRPKMCQVLNDYFNMKMNEPKSFKNRYKALREMTKSYLLDLGGEDITNKRIDSDVDFKIKEQLLNETN